MVKAYRQKPKHYVIKVFQTYCCQSEWAAKLSTHKHGLLLYTLLFSILVTVYCKTYIDVNQYIYYLELAIKVVTAPHAL